MKNLKVTINRSAGVKKYEVLPRQEKDMRGCCFCIKNANCYICKLFVNFRGAGACALDITGGLEYNFSSRTDRVLKTK